MGVCWKIWNGCVCNLEIFRKKFIENRNNMKDMIFFVLIEKLGDFIFDEVVVEVFFDMI